jgi:hypothetical protein
MDYLEAQTLLDPIPPPFGKRNMFPEYVPAVVEHPYFPPAAAAAAEEGAFFSRYANEDGDTFLQGGTVTGGNGGSETVPDYKVSDADTGLVQGLGTILYLEASCEATVADGVMLPGCRLNNASLETGPSVPPNHTFTTTSKTGKIYREIGRWEAGAFRPAGPPGDFLASGCLGNFNLWRE